MHGLVDTFKTVHKGNEKRPVESPTTSNLLLRQRRRVDGTRKELLAFISFLTDPIQLSIL